MVMEPNSRMTVAVAPALCVRSAGATTDMRGETILPSLLSGRGWWAMMTPSMPWAFTAATVPLSARIHNTNVTQLTER